MTYSIDTAFRRIDSLINAVHILYMRWRVGATCFESQMTTKMGTKVDDDDVYD